MADHEFTRTEIKILLKMLVLLNSSLLYVVQQLKELSANKLLTPSYIKKLTETTEEVQRYLDKANPQ